MKIKIKPNTPTIPKANVIIAEKVERQGIQRNTYIYTSIYRQIWLIYD